PRRYGEMAAVSETPRVAGELIETRPAAHARSRTIRPDDPARANGSMAQPDGAVLDAHDGGTPAQVRAGPNRRLGQQFMQSLAAHTETAAIGKARVHRTAGAMKADAAKFRAERTRYFNPDLRRRRATVRHQAFAASL